MKPVSIKDFDQIRMLSNLSVSPSGCRAALCCTKADLGSDAYERSIHVYDRNTDRIQPVCEGDACVWYDEDSVVVSALREPRDVRAVQAGFLRTVFYRTDIHSGKQKRLFALPLSHASLHRISEKTWLVCAREDREYPVLEGLPYQAQRKALASYLERKKRVVTGTELPFRIDGVGSVNNIRSALWICSESDGSLTRISPEDYNVRGFSISSTDDTVAYYGRQMDGFGYLDSSLYSYRISENKRVRIFPEGNYEIGTITLHQHRIWFPARRYRNGLPDPKDRQCRLYSAALTGNDVRYECEALGDLYGGPALGDCFSVSGTSAISVNGRYLAMTSLNSTSTIVEKRSAAALTPIVSDSYAVAGFDAAGDRLYCIASEKGGLNELYCISEDQTARRVSSFNRRFLRSRNVIQPEPLSFINRAGIRIDGFIMRPPNAQAGEKSPGVLQIHGGPRILTPNVFHHEMQAMANAGCYVFFCNPRGSSGRGEAFADIGGTKRFGTVDYEDILDFTDAVLAACPEIDPQRLAVCGGSYGGFMTNWIISQTSRFAAAVSQRPFVNQVGFWFAADFGLFELERIKNGISPCDWEQYWTQSPLKYAHTVTTPTLFLQSSDDYRCPEQESVEMFAALRHAHVPARLVIFQGESHNLSRMGGPQNRLLRLNEIFDWLTPKLFPDVQPKNADTGSKAL